MKHDSRPTHRRIAATLWIALSACATIEPMAPDPSSSALFEDTPQDERSNIEVRPAAHAVGEVIICGQAFAVDAPVVLWSQAGGYDMYDGREPGRSPLWSPERGYVAGRRAQSTLGRPAVAPATGTPAQLARAVDQFVLHFDVCGLSSVCFDILHKRELSVHFLLDIDGTIYQTMDLRDTAWHATKANDRSIGIEIAQIGARMPAESGVLDEWYSRDGQGLFIDLPARFGDGGMRTPHFRGRPARPALIEGRINGTRLLQYDFTNEQYASLAALTSTLTRALPQIALTVPRDASGHIQNGSLSDAEFRSFSGILGHYHIQTNKTDPGPAFDWERLLREAL